MEKNIIFSYKQGKSLIHKMPTIIKILFLPLIAILVFNLSIKFVFVLVLIQFIFCCTLKFSLKEQFTDLKPALFYGIMLIFANIIILFYKIFQQNQNFTPLLIETLTKKETYILILKILCIMQSTSILFKTSTPLEIRQGIIQLEDFFRKILRLKKSYILSETLALFFIYIPMLFEIWQKTKLSWQAKQGKTNIKMIFVIFPAILSISMNKAYKKTMALLARKN